MGAPESNSAAVAGVEAMEKESRCASLLPCPLSSKENGAPPGAGFHYVGRSTQQLGAKMHPQAAAVHGACIYVLSPTARKLTRWLTISDPPVRADVIPRQALLSHPILA